MGKICFTYGSVPELAELSPDKKAEVILASGGRFGKTPTFMRVWWFGVVSCIVVPFIAGVAVYYWHGSFISACWFAVVTELVAYSAWFHVRTSCLRPHIRAYLFEQYLTRE